MIKKLIFNAELQKETVHELTASDTGEIVATCTETGRVLKFPSNVSREKFDELVAAHKTSNEGQVTQASIDEALSVLGDDIPDEPVVDNVDAPVPDEMVVE